MAQQSAPTLITPTEVQVLGQKHSNILAKSLMVAGIGFTLITVFAFIINYFLYKALLSTFEGEGSIGWLVGLLAVAGVFAIVSMIMSVFLARKINTASLTSLLIYFAVDIISESILFGFLFTAAQLEGLKFEYLALAFAITGVVLALTGVFSRFLSTKAAVSLNKFCWIATIISLVILLPICIMTFSGLIGDTIWLIMSVVMCILAVLTMLSTFHTIRKSSVYLEMLDDAKVKRNYTMIFGFMLLSQIMMLLWYLIRILIIFGRN